MPAYLHFDGSTLPNRVGKNGPDGTRISDGAAGHLCFGPYFSLDAGSYIAGLYMRRLPGSARNSIDLDVFADGKNQLAKKTVSTADLFEDVLTLIPLAFDVASRINSTEIRVYVHNGVQIEIKELVVFSTRQRNWSGK